MGQVLGRKMLRSASQRAPEPKWSPPSCYRAQMFLAIGAAADSFGLVYSAEELIALVEHATATPNRARAAMANYKLVVELERWL
jgi:hypothetical protein